MAEKGLLLICVALSVLALVSGQNECDLPAEWHRTWWAGYKDTTKNSKSILHTYFNAKREEAYSDKPNEIKDTDLCENYETYEDTYYYGDARDLGTIAGFKVQGGGKAKRFCLEAIDGGDFLLIRQTNERERNDAYDVQECQGLLKSATSYEAIIKYPFPTFSGTFPVDPQTFKTTYTVGNGNSAIQCGGDADVSTLEMTANTIKIRTCTTDAPTYETPFNVDLTIAGYIADEQIPLLPALSTQGGMVLLAYPDSEAPNNYYFYLARYGVSVLQTELELFFPVNDKTKPKGYTSKDFVSGSVTDTMITFQVKSTECETDKPCKNNGTCTQYWLDYACDCTSEWQGDTCEDAYDVCDVLYKPCGEHGECQGNGATFTCDCSDGYEGEFCDDFDPCWTEPCLNGGTCVATSHVEHICFCPDEFYGQDCEDFDVCIVNDPCMNGGTCYLQGAGEYFCDCPAGWGGDDCETTSTGTTTQAGTGVPPTGGPMVCTETGHECQNGGDCIDFRCNCHGYWTGSLCEKISVWFIVSIVLIIILVIILVVVMIVCCMCCSGDAGKPAHYHGNDYSDVEPKSDLTMARPAPDTIQFNVLSTGPSQPNALY